MGGKGSGQFMVAVPERTWRPLADAISDAFGVTTQQMLYGDNAHRQVSARHIFWRALQNMGFSYPAIAAISGHNHTTVLDGVKSKALARLFDKPKKTPRNFIKPGNEYGLLTVAEKVERPEHSRDLKARWYKCRCVCGAETIVSNQNLSNGTTQSCGNTVHRRQIRAIKYGKPNHFVRSW